MSADRQTDMTDSQTDRSDRQTDSHPTQTETYTHIRGSDSRDFRARESAEQERQRDNFASAETVIEF